jgi:hypothetical protein
MITINESGMTFGPFAETHCFKIENSPLHQSAQPGIQIAEFLLVHEGNENEPPQVWIVEAKSSTPNPGSALLGAAETFAAFIAEIREKLLNALTLGVTACIGRHANVRAGLPQAFSDITLGRAAFRLILIVNGHRSEWLPPLQDALAQALRVTSRTWDLGAGSVVVMNDASARQRGLIV